MSLSYGTALPFKIAFSGLLRSSRFGVEKIGDWLSRLRLVLCRPSSTYVQCLATVDIIIRFARVHYAGSHVLLLRNGALVHMWRADRPVGW